jgi:transcriptional accessory protein Tex/SPT6
MADDGQAKVDVGSDTFKILLQLIEQGATTKATLDGIARDVRDLRDSTNTQLARLQERIGRAESLNERQEERIKNLEECGKKNGDDLKTQAREISHLKERIAYAAGAAAVLGAILGAALGELVPRVFGL